MPGHESSLSPGQEGQNRGPSLLGATIGITTVTTIFVIARLYVRGRILRKLHLDDYFIIFSLICGWTGIGFIIKGVQYGNGRHMAVLTTEQQENAIKWTIFSFPPSILFFGVPKLAVVAFLTRILEASAPRWHNIFLWVMAILCNISLFIASIFVFVQCDPPNSQWNFDIKGNCWSPWVTTSYAIGVSSFSVVVDLYLAIYPSFILVRLNLSRLKKIALSCALGIGASSAVVAIYKCTRLPNLASNDFTYDAADLLIWTIAEGGTIIIATSIPILNPLLSVFLGRNNFTRVSDERRNKRRNKRHEPTDSEAHIKSNLDLPPALRHASPPNLRMYPEEYFLVTRKDCKAPQDVIWDGRSSVTRGNVVCISTKPRCEDSGSSGARSQAQDSHLRPLQSDGGISTSSHGITRTDEFSISYER